MRQNPANQDPASQGIRAYRLEFADQPVLLQIEATDSNVDISAFVTVRHAGRLSLANASIYERYRILTRGAGDPWTILRLEKDRLSANFQGNPLWPRRALSTHPRLSEYFGLSFAEAERSCLVPTTSTINQKLARLLPHAPESSPVEFGYRPIEDYPRGPSGKVDDTTYVDTYIDTGKLPMGHLLDRDSVHDWSYHFVSFLFPDLLEGIRLALSCIRDNLHGFTGETAYEWNYYGHYLDANGNTVGRPRTEPLSHVDAVYRQMAIALDVGTAKVVQVLAMEQAGRLDLDGHEIQLCRTYLGRRTLDAVQSILWMERDLDRLLDLSDYGAQTISERPLDYLHDRLDRLEHRAASLIRPRDTERRRMAFVEALDSVPA